jgi:ClpP class serine protease
MRGQVLSGSGALAANLIDAIGDMATARALLVSTL